MNIGNNVQAESAITWWQDRLSRFVEHRKGLFKFLGRLETWVFSDEVTKYRIDRPVYICGLARAGSTVLLELLASHPGMVSHRYRDFPFVYTPIWWNRFVDRASRAKLDPVERFHKDRIFITAESPEAMEEVLWVAFFSTIHHPTQDNILDKETCNPGFEKFYKDHIRKLLFVRGGFRYLAKGNYNITRLQYLRKLFPDARFVIPVRDPINHVASLMKQHQLFCEQEKCDPRILNYMRRVGHFEFGLDLRPINVGNRGLVEKVQRLWITGEEVLGWAYYWASVYGFVADVLETDTEIMRATCVVHYDDLCNTPLETLARVYDHCDLDVHPETLQEQAKRVSPPSYYSMIFTVDQKDVIEGVTGETHRRIRRLCGPCP